MKSIILIILVLFSFQAKADTMVKLGFGMGNEVQGITKDNFSTSVSLRGLYVPSSDLKFGLEVISMGEESINTLGFGHDQLLGVGAVVEKIFFDVIHTGASLSRYRHEQSVAPGLELGWEPAWELWLSPSVYYRAQYFEDRNTVHSLNFAAGIRF